MWRRSLQGRQIITKTPFLLGYGENGFMEFRPVVSFWIRTQMEEQKSSWKPRRRVGVLAVVMRLVAMVTTGALCCWNR